MHFVAEGAQVIHIELVDIIMPAGPSDNFDQLIACRQEIVQLLCRRLDNNTLTEVLFLGSDADRAVVGVAGTHAQATNGLKR